MSSFHTLKNTLPPPPLCHPYSNSRRTLSPVNPQSGVKVCPYYQSDYDAEAENMENEENEDEIHSKRVATLTKQAETEGLLPYSKAIAYVFFFSHTVQLKTLIALLPTIASAQKRDAEPKLFFTISLTINEYDLNYLSLASLDPHQIRWSYTHFLQCTGEKQHKIKLSDVNETEIVHLWSHDFRLSSTMTATLVEKGHLDAQGNLGIPCGVSVWGGVYLSECRMYIFLLPMDHAHR
jgi:hypothetical protein